MPSNPSLQLQERLPRLRQSVISPPASHVPVPVVAQLPTRAPPPTVPFLAHLRFESFQALRCIPIRFWRSSRNPRNLRSQTLPVPLLAAFTFSRRCFSIQPCIEASVRSAAA